MAIKKLIECDECNDESCVIPTTLEVLLSKTSNSKYINNTCPCLYCPIKFICREMCDPRIKYWSKLRRIVYKLNIKFDAEVS